MLANADDPYDLAIPPVPNGLQDVSSNENNEPPGMVAAAGNDKTNSDKDFLDFVEQLKQAQLKLENKYKIPEATRDAARNELITFYSLLFDLHGNKNFQFFKTEKNYGIKGFPKGLDENDILYALVHKLEVKGDKSNLVFQCRETKGEIHCSHKSIKYHTTADHTFNLDDAYNMVGILLHNPNFGKRENPIIIEGTTEERKLLEQAIHDLNSLLPEKNRKHIGNPLNPMAHATTSNDNLGQYFSKMLPPETPYERAYRIVSNQMNDLPNFYDMSPRELYDFVGDEIGDTDFIEGKYAKIIEQKKREREESLKTPPLKNSTSGEIQEAIAQATAQRSDEPFEPLPQAPVPTKVDFSSTDPEFQKHLKKQVSSELGRAWEDKDIVKYWSYLDGHSQKARMQDFLNIRPS